MAGLFWPPVCALLVLFLHSAQGQQGNTDFGSLVRNSPVMQAAPPEALPQDPALSAAAPGSLPGPAVVLPGDALPDTPPAASPAEGLEGPPPAGSPGPAAPPPVPSRPSPNDASLGAPAQLLPEPSGPSTNDALPGAPAQTLPTRSPSRNRTQQVTPPAPAPKSTAQDTAVVAIWRIGGDNIWPFDSAKQTSLVIALSSVLPGTPQRNVTITDAILAKAATTRAGRRRHLLAPAQDANYSAADVSAEIDAGNPERAVAVRQSLSAVNLQAALNQQGVTASNVTLMSAETSGASAPHQCPFGTLAAGFCIDGVDDASRTDGGLATWIIIVIAVVGTALLVVAILMVLCCCLHRMRRRQRAHQAEARKAEAAEVVPAATAHPFWHTRSGTQGSTGMQSTGRAASLEPQATANPLVAATSAATAARSSKTVTRTTSVSSNENTSVNTRSSSLSGTQSAQSAYAAAARQASLSKAPSGISSPPPSSKRITAFNARARAFVAALPPKHAHNAATSLAARHAAAIVRVPGLGREAADYIKRPFKLGGAYEAGPGEIRGNGRVVAVGRKLGNNRSMAAELYFKSGTFLHARAFFSLVHSRLFVPEVYDILASSELGPNMTEMGMSAIVMEAPSYTLQDWLPYGDHDPAGRKRALVQVLEALEFLHGQGLVHRSLSPATLAWYESAARWQPTTFARWARTGSDKPLVYDLHYAAPEILMADVMGTAIRKQAVTNHGDLPAIGVVDPASDLWAVGALAWALFTGRPLFGPGTSEADVVAMLLGTKLLPFEHDPSLWMQFDKAQAAHLVQGLLARRPEERLTATEALEMAAQMSPRA